MRVRTFDADDRFCRGQVEDLVLIVQLGMEFQKDGHGIKVRVLVLDQVLSGLDRHPLPSFLVPILPDRQARAATKEKIGIIGYTHQAAASSDVDHTLEEHRLPRGTACALGPLLSAAHGPRFVVYETFSNKWILVLKAACKSYSCCCKGASRQHDCGLLGCDLVDLLIGR